MKKRPGRRRGCRLPAWRITRHRRCEESPIPSRIHLWLADLSFHPASTFGLQDAAGSWGRPLAASSDPFLGGFLAASSPRPPERERGLADREDAAKRVRVPSSDTGTGDRSRRASRRQGQAVGWRARGREGGGKYGWEVHGGGSREQRAGCQKHGKSAGCIPSSGAESRNNRQLGATRRGHRSGGGGRNEKKTHRQQN